MTRTLQGSDAALIDGFDGLLLDLDGVVYVGPEAIPHAVDSIISVSNRKMPVGYVTNNSSRSPQTVAEHLKGYGLTVPVDSIATSAQAAVALMQESLSDDARVLVVGGPGLREEVSGSGMLIVDSADDAPDAVVQGFAPDLTWRDLAEAAYAINRGAKFYATNSDLSIPTERGTAPGNGSLVMSVTNATGQIPVSAGKPEPELFWHAAKRLGSHTPIMVGDRLDTDLAGAVSADMAGLLVFTGVTSAEDVVRAASSERPTHLSHDLRGLFAPHPFPERDGKGIRCGSARAEVDAGSIVLKQSPELIRDGDSWLDAVRATAVAVWNAVDSGEEVDYGTMPNFSGTMR